MGKCFLIVEEDKVGCFFFNGGMEEKVTKSAWWRLIGVQHATRWIFPFQGLTPWKILTSKSFNLQFFQFKIWQLVKLLLKIWYDLKVLIQNLTRSKNCHFSVMCLEKAKKTPKQLFLRSKNPKTQFFLQPNTFSKLYSFKKLQFKTDGL